MFIPLPLPRGKKMQSPLKEHVFIYEKYFNHYGGEKSTTLQKMIVDAKRMGENACSLYEEYASEFDPGVSADDLECIFEYGIEGRPSIRSLIEEQAIQYRHILKFRTAILLDSFPSISVRYILVWKK